MDLRQLRYFVAVADATSFGRASTVLAVAQSAVSAQIARLESELGVEFFVRSPPNRLGDPAGRAVLAEASKTLSQADLTIDVASLNTMKLSRAEVSTATVGRRPRHVVPFAHGRTARRVPSHESLR